VLSVEDWAEIRRLGVSEKMPIKVIARTVGCSKNTVKKALNETEPPAYRRASAGSIVDVVEPRIRELLRAWPTMPATVIAERIGWDRGLTVLKDRVRELRPVYLPPDPASRTLYLPGEVAQCDFWFPDIVVPVGFGQTRTAKRLPVLTMVCGYCRWLSARLIPSRTAEDLFAGWWWLIAGLGAVPRLLVWDGEAAIGRWRRGVSELTGDTQAFRGVLGTTVKICKPADPEAKGLVERGNGYLETSFLPGRTFTGPDDFNNQLAGWLALANGRVKRSLGCAPTDRLAADRQAMLGLPPVPPQVGWSQTLRLPRDHYVRLDSNDYSVHPAAIGRRVLVSADLDRVRVVCDGQPVADHARIWARHQTISDPTHVEAATALRQHRLVVLPPPGQTLVEQRALSDYDTVFGLDQDVL
jgi:transposase